MKSDEQAIRELVKVWLDASERGDYATVLSLMTDDAVFMVPGQEPFGKEGWSERMKGVRVQAESDIREINVAGEWAWLRQHLRVTVTQSNTQRSTLSGYALAILKKVDGRWLLARDANLVVPEQ